MKHIWVALAAMFMLASIGQAQTVYDKYYVGVDLFWLVNRGTSSPSLMFKTIDSKRKKSGNFSNRKGMRYRIGFSFEKADKIRELVPNALYYYQIGSSTLDFTMGYEWHKSYKIFDFFYGFDVNFEYWHPTVWAHFWYYDGVTNNQFLIRKRDFSFGIAPVAGLSIRIIDGIHITMESTWNSTYVRSRFSVFRNQNLFESNNFGGFRTRFYPLSTFNATFSFR